MLFTEWGGISGQKSPLPLLLAPRVLILLHPRRTSRRLTFLASKRKLIYAQLFLIHPSRIHLPIHPFDSLHLSFPRLAVQLDVGSLFLISLNPFFFSRTDNNVEPKSLLLTPSTYDRLVLAAPKGQFSVLLCTDASPLGQRLADQFYNICRSCGCVLHSPFVTFLITVDNVLSFSAPAQMYVSFQPVCFWIATPTGWDGHWKRLLGSLFVRPLPLQTHPIMWL